MDQLTIPCETCGTPTPYTGTKRCTNCWEVEGRMGTYMLAPKALDFIRKHMPLLDGWVDGHPDAWDYEKVLTDNHVAVEWSDKVTADGITFEQAPPALCGWGFYWTHGAIHIGQTSEIIARKAAALFVSLWQRSVSASFCDKLMDGFIVFLERQESTTLSFLAEVDTDSSNLPFFRLTRVDMCERESFDYCAEQKIIRALDVQPDEEVIVTFRKRKTR